MTIGNRCSLRKIHPSEVDLRKYIANRDEYLYHDITSHGREFDTILQIACGDRTAWKAHFFEHGLPTFPPSRWGLLYVIWGNQLQVPMYVQNCASCFRFQVLQQAACRSPAASTSRCRHRLELLHQRYVFPGPGFTTAVPDRL